MGIKLREIDASLPDVELTPSLMAKMMLFKMSYIFLIFLVGCFIVVVYDFISPGFSIYDVDSTLTIAAIFALFSGIEIILLVSKKLTPIALIMIGLASPFILLKRLHFQNIIGSAPERMIKYVLPYSFLLIYKCHLWAQTEIFPSKGEEVKTLTTQAVRDARAKARADAAKGIHEPPSYDVDREAYGEYIAEHKAESKKIKESKGIWP